VRNLSGGNIQKLILGREISVRTGSAHRRPSHLRPGCRRHRVRPPKQIIELRDNGGAVLLVSEDLDELFMVCDRIAVMFEGRFMGEVTPDSCTIEQIGLMMAGSAVTDGGPASVRPADPDDPTVVETQEAH
jgi:ABC-type sugar transport system ATPase subunit